MSWHQISKRGDCSYFVPILPPNIILSLQWRHNECDGASNHRLLDCCLTLNSGANQRRHHIKAPRYWPLWGEPPVTGGPVTLKMFPFDDVIMWRTQHCWCTPKTLYQSLMSNTLLTLHTNTSIDTILQCSQRIEIYTYEQAPQIWGFFVSYHWWTVIYTLWILPYASVEYYTYIQYFFNNLGTEWNISHYYQSDHS